MSLIPSDQGGDKIPRKGGPGISQSDLLVINKVPVFVVLNNTGCSPLHDRSTWRRMSVPLLRLWIEMRS